MKNKDLDKSQTLAASSVIPKEIKEHFVKSTTYAGLDSVKQLPPLDSAQFTIDSILVFTTLGVELGNLLTQRQRKLCLNSPIGY